MMKDNDLNFDVSIHGKLCKATPIMNFELYGSYYCIYGVKNEEQQYDVYCGEIQGNTVVPIQNENDKNLTNKIVLSLVNAIRE